MAKISIKALIFYFSITSLLISNQLSAQSFYPEEITTDYAQKAKHAISVETQFDSKLAQTFFEDLYETKQNLFLNNSVYFEDQYTDFVNDIAKKLLATDEDLYKMVSIYVTKFSSRNAISLPDGSIFINIGLIAAAENEAQLAFVIAHEIAHVKNQHARASITKMAQLMEEQQNAENLAGNYFRQLRFSREHEFEADGFALSLMKSSDYNASESVKSLSLLVDSLDFGLTEHDIMAILSSDLYQLDSSSFVYYDPKRRSSGEILKIEDDNDLLLTHPSMDKRILALKEIMESMPEAYGGGNEYIIFDEEKFKLLIDDSRREMINNLFAKSEYISSLTLSLEALREDPSDEFMKVNVIRNLYQLAYYKEIENLENILDKNTMGNSDIMMEIKGFISEVSFDDIKKLAFGYAKKEVEGLGTDEELLFYHGLITKSYLGKEPARIIFNKYKAAYPNGKYVAYINSTM